MADDTKYHCDWCLKEDDYNKMRRFDVRNYWGLWICEQTVCARCAQLVDERPYLLMEEFRDSV